MNNFVFNGGGGGQQNILLETCEILILRNHNDFT